MNVGLDLHKRYSQHAVMDVFGTVQRQGRIDNTLEEMKEFSESLPAGSSIAIESSSTWYLRDTFTDSIVHLIVQRTIYRYKPFLGKTNVC